ncbi:MAG: thioredoxin family protein [Acidobacteriota bacterium]
MSTPELPEGLPADGLIAVVKKACPTCELVAPALAQLAEDAELPLTVFCQDDPDFPKGLYVHDDRELEASYRLAIQTVPTLLRVEHGQEVRRLEGWLRSDWQELSGVDDLAPELPPQRPGCGSRSVEPGVAERLEARFGDRLTARRVTFGAQEDDHEALFERGWTDGLPVVPPTPERVVRMLTGTDRAPDEIVATVPPNLVPCTVEKVAINAVMAGCKPEYLPVALAAVEAACSPGFGLHGLLATTLSHGPVVIVNGPITRRIEMNSGVNAMGQGNRANATIGRALQLVVRNVGGGRPGEVDRACLGSPGKYTFCFAENEADSPWESLAVERGFTADASTVTLFGGEAPRVIIDQLSRTPESLATSIAACLRTVCHPKLPMVFDALLVVSPEHARVFHDAGWDKARLRQELIGRLMLPWEDVERGAGGMAEGVPESMRQPVLPKFRPEGLLIVHAGGPAGLFSAIIGGWLNGEAGTQPTTLEVRS